MSIREAGKVLSKNFVEEEAPHTDATNVEKPAEKETPLAQKADPPPCPVNGGKVSSHTNQVGVRSREKTEKESDTQAPAVVPPRSETPSRNEPLTFALKNIDQSHPYVKALGLHEDTITAFGVGYYSGKGLMANHIVIPIYNLNRQLVSYAGLHPQDRTYTYPPKFRRELELYNLAAALADHGADQGVILVRHPLGALLLVSAGHSNAVAIMGDTLSDEQREVLLAEYEAGEKVTLFWPTHVDVVPTLSALLPDFFVRLRRYEEKGGTPLGFTVEEVPGLLA